MSDTTTTTTLEETPANIAPAFAASIDAPAFAAAYAAVSIAASTDTTRRLLGAVYIHVNADGSAEMRATDSYRLHAVTIAADKVHAAESVRGFHVRVQASALKATEVRRLAKAVTPRRGAGAVGFIRVECARGLASHNDTERESVAGSVTIAAVHTVGGRAEAAMVVPAFHADAGADIGSLLSRLTGTREVPTFDNLPVLNPAYLADIAKAADIATAGGTIRQTDAMGLKPNAWRASSPDLGNAFVGLLMPVRDPATCEPASTSR